MTADRPATEPRTPTGRSIIGQDYRGNEVYTITRQGVLAIEAEAAQGAAPRAESHDAPACPVCEQPMKIHPSGGDNWFCMEGHRVGISRAEAAQGAAPRAEGPLRAALERLLDVAMTEEEDVSPATQDEWIAAIEQANEALAAPRAEGPCPCPNHRGDVCREDAP